MIKAVKEIITDNIRYFSRTILISKLYLRKKNATSDLGWIWAVIKPLMYMLMFYFAISLGFRNSKDIDGIVCPYIIWLFAGMVAWFYISDILTGGPNCYRLNKAMIAKAGFPSSVVPMITVISNLFIHLILIIIVLVFAMAYGVRPSIYWLQLPVLTLLVAFFSYLWSFLFGMLNTVSADILNLIKSIRPAFFWLSGILFNSRARNSIVFTLNPITYLVEGYRSSIAYNMWFWQYDRNATIAFFSILSVMAVFSVIIYQRLRDILPELVAGI